ncbi:MFS transporter [Nocardia sp. NPDC048505]|uniref:MFS transporter n=1 Tax=unclassified Nocardia TaxID=2637762 RepID=UPI0034078351
MAALLGRLVAVRRLVPGRGSPAGHRPPPDYGVRGLTLRAVLFKGSGDLIPLYALYALLFAEHGLSTAQISSLLAIWSLTAFVLEVPSGAWADTVSRRALLILSAVLMVCGFTAWTVAPSYLGFAIGFVLWGTAGALESGTFEALVYDDLVARGERAAYPRIMGYTRAAEETTVVVAIMAAALLYAWGGYALVGWSSVAVAAVHAVIALSMPRAPMAVSAGAVEELEEQVAEADSAEDDAGPTESVVLSNGRAEQTGSSGHGNRPAVRADSASEQAPRTPAPEAGGRLELVGSSPGRGSVLTNPAAPQPDSAGANGQAPSRNGQAAGESREPDVFARYLLMLRTGIGEAVRVPRVRYGVLLGSLLYGITAFDEYFALLAQSAGAATAVVAVLVGVTVLGSMAGALLAGRTEGIAARTMALALVLAAALFITGVVVAGLATAHSASVYLLTGFGFTAIGASYGIVYNSSVVAEARLQDSIEGPARATVTSVSGLLAEVVALAIFGFVALATVWLSMASTLALLGGLILAIALVTPSWLPRHR